jgi:peptide/nickel transport system substrate-binding protein
MRIRELSRKLALLLLLAAGTTAASISAPGCKPRSGDDGGGLPRSETLYLAGRQWGEPVTFNPLFSNPDWPINGLNLMYQTVLLYSPQSGKMEPLLAEKFERTDTSLFVTLNAAARWSDGKPVTGWDVKFSYDLGDKYKSLVMAPVWVYLKEIRLYDAAGKLVEDKPTDTPDYPRRVEFVLDPENLNPLVMMSNLQETRIVPRHVIEPLIAKAGNIDEFLRLKLEKEPVISGPYQLKLYNSEKIVVQRRDDYWGNKALYDGKLPGPKYIVHPIYKSNSAFSIGLQQGRLDMSSTFVPRIWLKAKKGVKTWFDEAPYFLSVCMPMLFINVKHEPLGDVAYRRAMAFAINYSDVRELAMSGYSEPLQPGLILPFGIESKYYNAEDVKQYGTSYDLARAKATLAEAGYKSIYNEKGELVETRNKAGQKVPTVYIKSPTGWTDWESIVKIAVRGMREAGIDARERFVDASIFWNDIFQGEFDLIMFTPVSPPSPAQPWQRFEFLFTTQDFAPQGEKMYKNMGRFNDPKSPHHIPRIGELLSQIPTLKDEAEITKAYRELNIIFMQQQPTIPLVYRPDNFYEFSTRHWDGFPTAKNPYLPPQIPGERMGTHMLWKIRKVPQN